MKTIVITVSIIKKTVTVAEKREIGKANKFGRILKKRRRKIGSRCAEKKDLSV